MFNKKKILYILLGLIIIGLGVWGYSYYQHQKEVLIKVGELEITKAEFEQELRYKGKKFIDRVDKKALLEDMITKKLFLNKAKSIGLEEESKMKREYDYMLIGKIRKRFIEAKRKEIKISKADVEAYYQQHKESYKLPFKRKFAIVFAQKRRKNSSKEKQMIEEKFAKLIKFYQEKKLPPANKGFGRYAIEYSEHQVSRYRGGELGWFDQGSKLNWEQSVLDKGFSLAKVGDLSEIIETDKGYYMLRIMEEKKAKYKTLKEVYFKVKHQLLFAKQKAINTNFEALLRREYEVTKGLAKLDEIRIKTSSFNQEKKPPLGVLNNQ
ncbi:MAG: peptidyl-prolyl cis-trans isomerase [Sulfurovum sp.]